MKRTRKEAADLVEVWMKEMCRGQKYVDYLEGMLMLAVWLENGYKRAETRMNRHNWLRRACGYAPSYNAKSLD